MPSVSLGNKWLILTVSTFSFVTLMIAFSSYPIVADDMAKEVGLTYTQIGLIMSAFSVAYALAQIPAGIISDRYGGSRVASLSVTFLALTALFFSLAKSYEMAFIMRALMGLSGGFLLPATMKLLPQWFSNKEIDRAMGILGTGQGIALALTPLIIPLIMSWFEWRIGFNFSTITAIVAAVLSWLILRDLSHPQRSKATSARGIVFNLKKSINRRLLLLTSFNFTSLAVLTGILTWTPPFLIDTLHLTLVEMGLITAVIGVTIILSSFASGILSTSIGGKNVIFISMLMCVLLPYLLYFSSSSAMAFLLIALLGWAIMFYFGPTWGEIPRIVKPEYIGLSFGVFNTLSFIGSALSPAVAGIVLDHTYRFDLAFLSISLIALLGLIGSIYYIIGDRAVKNARVKIL